MKVMAINGSPRKNKNTATLLAHALEGVASQGAETEFIHLYDLSYKGCVSCFSCKKRGGKSYGRCAAKDDLTPVLERIREVDALILGSPVYFFSMTGQMRSFMERLLFPYLVYSDPPQSLFPKKIKVGLIYTMNATQKQMEAFGPSQNVMMSEMITKTIFGASESLLCFDTLQFDDYSKVVADRFDAAQKAKRREEVFPLDCKRAFDMGARFTHPISSD